MIQIYVSISQRVYELSRLKRKRNTHGFQKVMFQESKTLQCLLY